MKPLPTLLALALSMLALGDALAKAPLPTASYRLGLLKRGPTWTPDRSPYTDSLQAGHMANIRRMADEGALLGAGPFLHGGALRGVFLFRHDARDVEASADRDPAIEAGRLVLDLYRLEAQPGVGAPYAARARAGAPDSMVRHAWVLLRPAQGGRARAATAGERARRRRWIETLVADGRLALSGDVSGADSLAGIHVVRGDSSAAARLLEGDPAVRSGRWKAEILPWFCAYGVMPGDTLSGREGR